MLSEESAVFDIISNFVFETLLCGIFWKKRFDQFVLPSVVCIWFGSRVLGLEYERDKVVDLELKGGFSHP
jgi:hypothetical protein